MMVGEEGVLYGGVDPERGGSVFHDSVVLVSIFVSILVNNWKPSNTVSQ